MGSECCKPSKHDDHDAVSSSRSPTATADRTDGNDRRHRFHHALHQYSPPNSRHHRANPTTTTTDGVQARLLGESVQVEKLVRDALSMIRTIVEQEPEPPVYLTQLATIADRDWVLVVHSLCRAIPLEDALGPAVISLVLDDCPLPSKDALMGLIDLLPMATNSDPAYERNLCVVLACVADKLAGPSSVTLLNKTTLTFLTDRLDYRSNPATQVILFAMIALEKFAQTSENKVTIERFIAERAAECAEGDGDVAAVEQRERHPLEALEGWADEVDINRRQVGFCAQWALDNIFVQPSRDYSYLKVDTRGINAMLNNNDVSEYLKISPNGLEARGDASSFESVRSTFEVSSGCWYYEVQLVTAGIMQIGWATKDSKFCNHEGCGIGDDEYSIAYDGCRQLIWHRARNIPISHGPWKPNDILGCLLDIDRQECIFSLNGHCLSAGVCASIFESTKGAGFFAAASFMTYQQCRFNFGLTDFLYPPRNRAFKNFNDYGQLSPEVAMIVPRHIKLRRGSISGANVCSLCVDLEATITLEPCGHSGFCERCANILENCPLCRADIFRRATMGGTPPPVAAGAAIAMDQPPALVPELPTG